MKKFFLTIILSLLFITNIVILDNKRSYAVSDHELFCVKLTYILSMCMWSSFYDRCDSISQSYFNFVQNLTNNEAISAMGYKLCKSICENSKKISIGLKANVDPIKLLDNFYIGCANEYRSY